jgi:DNA-binding response OmpR family regulator
MTNDKTQLLVVFPDPAPIDVARTLDLSGYSWKAVKNSDALSQLQPANGWAGAVVDCSQDPEFGWALCRARRRCDLPVNRIIVLVSGAQLADLEMRDDLFDDFCLAPIHPREFDSRLRHLFYTELSVSRESLIEYGGLVLNTETYQASFGGNPLDLTYMEYELLKFLSQNPGKVFSREILLSGV